MEGAVAGVVHGIDDGTPLQQRVQHRREALLRRSHERRGAVALRAVAQFGSALWSSSRSTASGWFLPTASMSAVAWIILPFSSLASTISSACAPASAIRDRMRAVSAWRAASYRSAMAAAHARAADPNLTCGGALVLPPAPYAPAVRPSPLVTSVYRRLWPIGCAAVPLCACVPLAVPLPRRHKEKIQTQ